MKTHIEIKESLIKGAGRGIFATANIKKGAIIEVCPVLIFNKKDTKKVMKSSLQNYVFEIEGKKNKTMMALGNGSLYNHSDTNNAYYEIDENNLLYIMANEAIEKGSEIYINYGNKGAEYNN